MRIWPFLELPQHQVSYLNWTYMGGCSTEFLRWGWCCLDRSSGNHWRQVDTVCS